MLDLTVCKQQNFAFFLSKLLLIKNIDLCFAFFANQQFALGLSPQKEVRGLFFRKYIIKNMMTYINQQPHTCI